MKTILALVAGALTLGSASLASARDFCKFYAWEGNGTGHNATYFLPDVEEDGGTAWYAASSVRRTKWGLENPGVVYKNADEINILANDSAVRLYLFTGDFFDGKVQVVTCAKGDDCTVDLAWMKDKVQSFICQREHDVGMTVDKVKNREGGLLQTALIANEMSKIVDGKLEDSDQLEDSDTKYGRMRWTTAIKRCQDFAYCWPDNTELNFHDELQYTYKSQLDPEWSAREYKVWIHFWLRPRVENNNTDPFDINESGWHVSVEDNGPLTDEIFDGVRDKVVALFDTIGDKVTKIVRDAVLAFIVDKDLAEGTGQTPEALRDAFLNKNIRLVLTYACNSKEIWVKDVGESLSDAQKAKPCDSGVSSDLLAPHIQLVKRFK